MLLGGKVVRKKLRKNKKKEMGPLNLTIVCIYVFSLLLLLKVELVCALFRRMIGVGC